MRFLGAVALLLMTLALAGCGSSTVACSTQPTGTVVSGVREITIDIGSDDKQHQHQYMRPDNLCASKAEKVRFIVVNKDDIFHDVRIDYPGYGAIEHEALPHTTKRTSLHGTGESFFTADTAGTFEIYCEVGGKENPGSHYALGMKGTFTVAG